MSAPPSSRCVANECRSVCGVTRRPGRERPPYPSTSARISRGPSGLPFRLKNRAGDPSDASAGRPSRSHSATLAHGVVGHRDLALLRPLPQDHHAAAGQVDVLHAEPGRLADPDPGAVEQLEDRAVALGDGPSDRVVDTRRSGSLHEDHRLGRSQDRRQPVDDLGSPQQEGRIRVDQAFGDGPPVERSDRAHPAGDRRARVAERVLLGEEPSQETMVGCLERGSVAGQERREGSQIVPVGRDRMRREVTLQSQMVRECRR